MHMFSSCTEQIKRWGGRERGCATSGKEARFFSSPLSLPNSVGLAGHSYLGTWSVRSTYTQLLIPFYMSLVLILTLTFLPSGMLDGVTGFKFGFGKASGLM